MEKRVLALTDYKGHFGSKSNSKYYRSGMDLTLLKSYFEKYGYELEFLNFKDIDFKKNDWGNKHIVYTSQEDSNYEYKKYIEDVISGLSLIGANVIPSIELLKSNNNKVFMEFVRDIFDINGNGKIVSKGYGTFEDFVIDLNDMNITEGVLKKSYGATSSGVYLFRSKEEALKIAKRISKSTVDLNYYKDIVRPSLHKGYVKESKHRRKFIYQNFIPGLQNDWKILVFGEKFFIEYRGVRKNDFRASGSQKFKFDDEIYEKIPKGIFTVAESVKNKLKAPHFSIDIGYINNQFFIFEFQALYFSSYAQNHSKTYFVKEGQDFVRKEGSFELEELYAQSTIMHIEKRLYQ
jgi:hypothetical protein